MATATLEVNIAKTRQAKPVEALTAVIFKAIRERPRLIRGTRLSFYRMIHVLANRMEGEVEA